MPSILKKLIVILLAISIQSFAQQSNYQKLDKFLDTLDKNNKLMGTMTITKDGKDVYNKAIGFANIEVGIKNTRDTKFRIGSITKTFTAVMIFQMIEEKALTLETPLAKYFPKMPNASKITIDDLLTHSSGLFNITNAEDFRTWMVKPTSQEQMLARMLRYQAQFEPGEKNEYSNTNFILLGYIAEAIDQQPYAEILRQRITSKIDLKDTYAGDKIDGTNNESLSYSLENSRWQLAQETDMSNPAGAGVIVSTTRDVAKFFTKLFSNQLISEESLKIMTTSKGDYGRGVFTQELNDIRMFGHNGGIDGFRSFAVYIPKEKLALAVFSNAGDYVLMSILMNGISVAMGQDFEIPTFSKMELTEAEAKQYEGEYSSNKVPFKLLFKARGTTVLMEVSERNLIKEITPTKQHQFKSEAMGITLEFDLKNNTLFVKEAGAESLKFKKQ